MLARGINPVIASPWKAAPKFAFKSKRLPSVTFKNSLLSKTQKKHSLFSIVNSISKTQQSAAIRQTRTKKMTSRPTTLVRSYTVLSLATLSQNSTPGLNNDSKKRIVLETGACQIPHPSKAAKGGEDTYFVASNGHSLGVFDGVGGWASAGIDPRDVPVRLSAGAMEAVDKLKMTHPVEIMQHSVKNVGNAKGSSTACIASIIADKLSVANLGDSGLMVLGSDSNDRPTDSALYQFQLEKGDLIILGTDGLFDNVGHVAIANFITELVHHNNDITVNDMSKSIAQKAFSVSQDPKADTPFARSAVMHRFQYRGGKPDDITVLVAKFDPDIGFDTKSSATPSTTSAPGIPQSKL